MLSLIFETLSDWPEGTMVSVVCVVVAAVILYVLGGLFVDAALPALDLWARPKHQANAIVMDRRLTPAYRESRSVYNVVFKMPMQKMVDCPADWELCVAFDGKRAWASVSKATYRASPVGSSKQVTYVLGRLSGRPYVKLVV